jgi:phage protein D
VAHTYQLLVGGAPVDASFYGAVIQLEVEENIDLPSAIQISVGVAADGSGDLTQVNSSTFSPYANLALVVTADGKSPECIFDGYVLSHKLHLDRGIVSSKLEVWGQDRSWSMNLTEKTHEWADMNDVSVASAIFGANSITPASDNAADTDDSATHSESGHTLMQRASDIQFLRQLARRNGKLCRVYCGSQAGQPIGYFAKPNLTAAPAATLTLNDPQIKMLSELDIEWDVMRPTEVVAGQDLLTDSNPAQADVTDSGLLPLAERNLASFAGQTMEAMLTTTVDDNGELQMRAASLLREGGFFVRCTGKVTLDALGLVLRAGSVVQLAGVGSLHSGNYFVWSVRHTIKQDSYEMAFVLVRNAVGSPPASLGSGLLGGLA